MSRGWGLNEISSRRSPTYGKKGKEGQGLNEINGRGGSCISIGSGIGG